MPSEDTSIAVDLDAIRGRLRAWLDRLREADDGGAHVVELIGRLLEALDRPALVVAGDHRVLAMNEQALRMVREHRLPVCLECHDFGFGMVSPCRGVQGSCALSCVSASGHTLTLRPAASAGGGSVVAMPLLEGDAGLYLEIVEAGRETAADGARSASGSGEEESVSRLRDDGRLLGHGQRILLVDDEPSLLAACSQVLRKLGYDVLACGSGERALEAFQVDPDSFDLVITDQTMTGMPGDEMLRELLRRRPDLPSVVCTGHSDRLPEKDARGLGVQAYLTKPFRLHLLCEAVARVIATDR